RSDVMTSARKSFMQITKDRLVGLKISLVEGAQNTEVRSYEFEYEEGPFKKQQLVKIVERDSEGNLFYSNTMAYYDDVETEDLINSQDQSWNGSNQNLTTPLQNIATLGVASLIPQGSVLGAGESSGFSVGLRV